MNRYRIRSTGRKYLGSAFDALLLMRPRQWPILSAQFAVGVFCAPALHGAWTGSTPIDYGILLAAWLAWVVGLNGGTLAYNSAYDRDTESIAYLDDPPTPPTWLAGASLAVMIVSPLIGFRSGPPFMAVTAACVILSVLYSHPLTRWKGVPGLDLLVNMVGFGAGTTLAGLAAGTAAAGGGVPWSDEGLALAVGFALLFGSFYPMTQLYQLESDRLRGDRTLASALGRRRALNLALLLGLGAFACFSVATEAWEPRPRPRMLISAAMLLWIAATGAWRQRCEGLDVAAQARWMYIMLAVWAVVDASILVARYAF